MTHPTSHNTLKRGFRFLAGILFVLCFLWNIVWLRTSRKCFGTLTCREVVGIWFLLIISFAVSGTISLHSENGIAPLRQYWGLVPDLNMPIAGTGLCLWLQKSVLPVMSCLWNLRNGDVTPDIVISTYCILPIGNILPWALAPRLDGTTGSISMEKRIFGRWNE